MQKVQNAILEYARGNKYLAPMIKFASAMAVVYPVYLIVSRLSFLDFAWRYISMISAIMYIAYFIGTILCFAGNKLIPLDVAYSCMALNYMFGLMYGISMNRLTYMAFYALIACFCIVATTKTTQWAQAKEDTLKTAAKYVEATEDILSGKSKEEIYCPNCGNKCSKDMKFCNNCGTPIK